MKTMLLEKILWTFLVPFCYKHKIQVHFSSWIYQKIEKNLNSSMLLYENPQVHHNPYQLRQRVSE